MSQLLLQLRHGQREKFAGQLHTRLQHMQASDPVVVRHQVSSHVA